MIGLKPILWSSGMASEVIRYITEPMAGWMFAKMTVRNAELPIDQIAMGRIVS
jgi:hypothetical protein